MSKAGPPPRRSRRAQMPMMLMAGLALVAALWAGLIRLGWAVPSLSGQLIGNHGPLMVNGFLGTVISLERAVALGRNQGGRQRYMLVPLFAGLSAVALLLGLPPVVARLFSVAAAVGLVIIFVVIYRWQPGVDHGVMGLAAGLWLVGNVLWLAGWPIPRAVPWWIGFLILTIAGERLELARVLLLTRGAREMFIAAVTVFTGGLVISLAAPDIGIRVAGAGLVFLGLWLLRFDIARITIRREGLTRFIAACLLPGYVWLLVGGVLWLYFGASSTAGMIYDVQLHALLLGFVISMIFGHAPVIIPAVMGVAVPYQPFFYVHLVVLHLSLVLRVFGDLIPNWEARRWGGLLNEVAVVLFLAATVAATRMAKK